MESAPEIDQGAREPASSGLDDSLSREQFTPWFRRSCGTVRVRGAPTSKLNDILKLVDEADKVDDTNVTFTDPERRASIDDLGSEDIGSL